MLFSPFVSFRFVSCVILFSQTVQYIFYEANASYTFLSTLYWRKRKWNPSHKAVASSGLIVRCEKKGRAEWAMHLCIYKNFLESHQKELSDGYKMENCICTRYHKWWQKWRRIDSKTARFRFLPLSYSAAIVTVLLFMFYLMDDVKKAICKLTKYKAHKSTSNRT